ncbi:A-kinase anchor protein 12b isoform X2 [Gambusia affinis]|uniref:A-kinase anchor protein 12b isoform X2 n=1 Tax=Gambusia affinis TaxID=33528 RepID=UPI001CDD03C6|nr:A-kinase anchor protein 12b isoform X2 [Gambusia affinis]
MLGTITLTVGQPDGVPLGQKEEAPESTETAPADGTPHVNGEKMEKESPSTNDISAVEEKVAEEKTDDAGEVGFKKIFTIVGLKFTLKKDKSDETDPVTLLTVKDKEEEISSTEEPAKDKEDNAAEENTPSEENKAQIEASTPEGETAKKTDKDESTDAQPEGAAAEATNEEVKEEKAEKEAESTPPARETGMSPFRKLFFVGLFSNLRKKSSMKKTKEEEEKEAAEKEETAKSEESTAEEKGGKDVAEQSVKEENVVSEEETKEEAVVTEEETKEQTAETPVEAKSEPESKHEAPSPQEEAKSDATQEVTTPTESTTDQSKHEDQKAEASADEKVPAEVSAEAELQSSQEKSKSHGSPLKKLFTGAGLKKLSTKRQKNKKESDSKLTESGEQGTEHPQSSAESEEAAKVDSGPSSPEASGEHPVAAEANQLESSQETEGEVASDGEKKKDSVIASFRKLVTPKKHAKRSSDSEDEGTSDKPTKSATLSSSESAPLAEKNVEEEEGKEDKGQEEEPKTENTEKLTSSTEETKRKMDTSVSWEALMCMGGPKKRTRKTSDSDEEETKAEEEITGATAAEEDVKEERKNEDATDSSQNPENEEVASAPEPVSAPPVRESPWSTLKRLVMSKNKPKSEEKPDGAADQAQQDTETQKEESSFSLRKLFPGRKKKVVEKQPSADQGSGEEDSDTPAVVPLSEYDDQVEVAQEAPKEAATVQSKVSAEDRAPSWIPASIEGAEDQHDQLSDIPEEAENAATPKSVDTDIAEDETDDLVAPSTGLGRTGRRLSTAEVKPITPAPAAATSPVPQGPKQNNAEEIIGAIEAQITEIPTQTSVTLEDVPLEKASEKTESEPETENAKTVTIAFLEKHAQGEASALCIGLETKEIAEVAVEQAVEPSLESMVPVGHATDVEMVVEEKPVEPEEAAVSEDPVLQAHINKVQTLELEPLAAKLSEVAEIEVASESYEPEIEKLGAVSTENSEVIQPTRRTENSPKTVVSAIEPIPETAVCIQSVEVSEVTVESKEGAVDVEEVAEENQNIEGAEIAHPAVVPSEESAVITETVLLVAPNEAGKNKEIETQSAVIAKTVIKEAVDKVLEDAPQPKKPIAAIPTPDHATATTEGEIGITADQVVITDTPVPDVYERPVQKSPQPLCVAMEVIETVPIEITENIKEDNNEEEEPKKDLKKAVEVQVREDSVIEEEVTEIKGEGVEESEKDQEGEVKETSENGNKSEALLEEKKEKAVETHMPTQVVLQSAQEVEEQPVKVETVEMLEGESSNTSVTAENPSRQNKLPDLTEEPQESSSAEAAAASQCLDADESQLEQKPSAKCAEVMAQVIEVIEEAVKEIEPVSTEITAAS